MNKIDYNKDNIYYYAEYGSNAYKSNHNPQQLRVKQNNFRTIDRRRRLGSKIIYFSMEPRLK